MDVPTVLLNFRLNWTSSLSTAYLSTLVGETVLQMALVRPGRHWLAEWKPFSWRQVRRLVFGQHPSDDVMPTKGKIAADVWSSLRDGKTGSVGLWPIRICRLL
jgi:hypothetical protein